MKLLITGGHHTSAIPVIKKLRNNHKDIEIFWIGHKRTLKGNKADTLEYKEISSLGIPFYDLKAGKFYKTFDPVRLIKIPFGFFQSFYYLVKIKPKVILSFGGYLAVPVVISGWVLKIPSITHEQTVVAGYANKLISKFAKKVLISFEESRKFFPEKKVIYTGLPLRESIFKVRSNNFIFENNLPVIYITAGKTGSHLVNETIKICLKKLLTFSNVIHQCGEHSQYKDFEDLKRIYEKLKIDQIYKIKQDRNYINSSKDSKILPGKYYIRKFIFEDEIGEAYSKADLIVSRAGAHTVSELIALSKTAVLIPIPWVSHNEQNKNAKLLESRGLSIILDQKNLNENNFIDSINKALKKINTQNLNDLKEKQATQIKGQKKETAEKPEDKIINEIIKISG